jgi:N-acetylgalactosamine kinase
VCSSDPPIASIIEECKTLIDTYSPLENKIRKIFPEFFNLYDLLHNNFNPDVELCAQSLHKLQTILKQHQAHKLYYSQSLSAKMLEQQARYVNISIYLIKAKILFSLIGEITANNVQKEEYLTDLIEILTSHGYKIKAIPIPSSDYVMSYNTPNELIKINEYVSKIENPVPIQFGSITFHSPDEWILQITQKTPLLMQRFREIYGENYEHTDEKWKLIHQGLMGYRVKFGIDQPCCIIRVPGRINLMGRHVDHRGGDVNMVAIDREIICIASGRLDDEIRAYNYEEQEYPEIRFKISDIIAGIEWKDWFDFINNSKINQMVRNSQGDWGNYIKAAALRLQIANPSKTLKGFNMFVIGNIPKAAGLSSSSALVVATLEALCHINNHTLHPKEFIDLCGEGEWFVGTRGGSADHAAIKMSNRGNITQIGFFPFKIKGFAPFPDMINLVVINSMKKATKSKEELKRYNEKVLAYEIGLDILHVKYPHLVAKMQYLRDINEETLQIATSEIVKMFLAIPLQIKMGDLKFYLPEKRITYLKQRFTLFVEEDIIPIRPIVIFGVCECYRSRQYLDFFRKGELEQLGQLMYTSHDGDRVVQYHEFSMVDKSNPFEFDCSDEHINEYLKETPNFLEIAGAYQCSVPLIDFIVDYLKSVPKVFGAQISGAGLGGCVMALIEKTATHKILDELLNQFQKTWGYRLEVFITTPMQGAGTI